MIRAIMEMQKQGLTPVLRTTDRLITIGALVAGIKRAIANPDATFKRGISTWWPTTGREIRRDFYSLVEDSINSHLPPRKDHRGPQRRLLAKFKAGLSRSCAWCGTEFQPNSIGEHCCSPSCQSAYAN